MGTQLPLPKRGHSPIILSPCQSWPNGCMDQDATWYGGNPWSRPHCAGCWPSAPLQKGGTTPNFRPCLLSPNGCMPWMDQDATWYDGRPQPRQHCVRCGPSSTPKGHNPQISAHVSCGQTARCIRIPLGTEMGLGPANIVLDGAQLPQNSLPIFSPYLLWQNGHPSQVLLSLLLF